MKVFNPFGPVLAKVKIPKKIVFGYLPKTSTGKIKKYELRAKAKELS